MHYDPQHSQAELHIAMIISQTPVSDMYPCIAMSSSQISFVVAVALSFIVAIVGHLRTSVNTCNHLSSPAAVDIIGTQCTLFRGTVRKVSSEITIDMVLP